MSVVKVKIFNREYQLACNDGEEHKLIDLATRLDKRLQENSRKFRGANETMVMLLTSLVLEDQLQEMQNNSNQDNFNQEINKLANHIDNIAKRIELL